MKRIFGTEIDTAMRDYWPNQIQIRLNLVSFKMTIVFPLPKIDLNSILNSISLLHKIENIEPPSKFFFNSIRLIKQFFCQKEEGRFSFEWCHYSSKMVIAFPPSNSAAVLKQWIYHNFFFDYVWMSYNLEWRNWANSNSFMWCEKVLLTVLTNIYGNHRVIFYVRHIF